MIPAAYPLAIPLMALAFVAIVGFITWINLKAVKTPDDRSDNDKIKDDDGRLV